MLNLYTEHIYILFVSRIPVFVNCDINYSSRVHRDKMREIERWEDKIIYVKQSRTVEIRKDARTVYES